MTKQTAQYSTLHRPPLSRHQLIQLSTRPNFTSAWKVSLHFGLLLTTGTLTHLLFTHHHAELALCVLLLHGMIWSFLGYAGLGHELQHHSVFSNHTLNETLYWFVSFLTWNNPVYFRASHQTHHRYTLAQHIDFEVNPTPEPQLITQAWRTLFFDWQAAWRAAKIFWINAQGQVPGPFGQSHFPPNKPHTAQLVKTARQFLALHVLLGLIGVFVLGWHWLFLFTLAPFICTWPNRCLAKLQHTGLPHNQNDFRLNCRTIQLPTWLGFLYWNMHYHIEHHMYPNIPYAHLPALRQTLLNDLPPATQGWQTLFNTLKK